MKEKLIKLVCLIMQKCMYKNHDFTSYILLASTYFEKAFGKDYHNDFFKAAKDSGIIECNGVYKRGTKKNKGIPYGYRLNQNMLNCSCPVFYQDKKSGGSSIESGGCDNFIFINRDMTYQKNDIINDIQDDISKKTENLSDNISNSLSSSTASRSSSTTSSFSSTISLSSNSLSSYHIIPRFFDKAIIFDDLSSLVFNEKRLWKATQEHIYSISSRLLVDDKIERNFFKVNNTTLKTYYDISKKSALSWATENNVYLIQDGNHFYFKKIEQYIEDKKQSLVASYNWQMTKLMNNIFYAGRNEVNKRLDHNLTCAGKHLMKVIKEDNDLVEIDIKNSQFAIHAYWMKQEDLCVHADVQKYYDLCVTGTLYEGLAESLNISRNQAKQLMMEIAFSSVGNNTPVKALFKRSSRM